MNFGWPIYEGRASHRARRLPDSRIAHGSAVRVRPRQSVSAVMSAGVYRRPVRRRVNGFPREYEGDYFFSDYYSGYVWRLHGSGSTWDLASSVPGPARA